MMIWAREVTVGDDHLITFEDKNISPSPVSYLAHHFAPGDKFRAAVNPWAFDTLHLFDALGGWVGQVKLWQRPAQIDMEAITRQMGRGLQSRARIARAGRGAGSGAHTGAAGRCPPQCGRATEFNSMKAPSHEPKVELKLAESASLPETKREVTGTVTTVPRVYERKVYACNKQLREILLKLRDSERSTWSNAKFARALSECARSSRIELL
jgi:hypothetical protein